MLLPAEIESKVTIPLVRALVAKKTGNREDVHTGAGR
jgi:hypothetical protein